MRSFRHRQRITVVAWLIAVMVVAGSCGSSGGTDDADAALLGVVRSPALEVASVSLPVVNRGGAAAPIVAPAGELLLVYFGYTSCPDVCPTTMTDLKVAVGDLPADLAGRVTVAMATVDPERDTDDVLADYVTHFFDDALALRTTDPDELASATEAFGVQFEVASHAAGSSYEVSHTAVTYVVDDTGTVVVEWPFGFTSEAMTSDLTTLLTEETS